MNMFVANNKLQRINLPSDAMAPAALPSLSPELQQRLDVLSAAPMHSRPEALQAPQNAKAVVMEKLRRGSSGM
jgi:hypothetical protein